MVRQIRKRDAVDLFCGKRRIEQTKVNLRGVLREHGKIDSLAIPGRSERSRAAGPNSLNCHPDVILRTVDSDFFRESQRSIACEFMTVPQTHSQVEFKIVSKRLIAVEGSSKSFGKANIDDRSVKQSGQRSYRR